MRIHNAHNDNANLVFFNPDEPTPISVRFCNELLGRVKDHTHELSDDNPIKPLAKKYIWADRLSRSKETLKKYSHPVVEYGPTFLKGILSVFIGALGVEFLDLILEWRT